MGVCKGGNTLLTHPFVKYRIDSPFVMQCLIQVIAYAFHFGRKVNNAPVSDCLQSVSENISRLVQISPKICRFILLFHLCENALA